MDQISCQAKGVAPFQGVEVTVQLLILGQESDRLGEDVALLLEEQVGQNFRHDVVQVLEDCGHG